MEGKPFVIMMRGFTAVGKSTVARHLEETLENTEAFHTARTRKELGLEPGAGGSPGTYEFDLRDERFVNEISRKVYGEIAERAQKSLSAGRNVILDGTYNFAWQRQRVSDLCRANGCRLYIIECVCSDEDEIKRRLEARLSDPQRDFNEATSWKTYLSTREYSEKIELEEFKDIPVRVITYDTMTRRLSIRPEGGPDDPTLDEICKNLGGAG